MFVVDCQLFDDSFLLATSTLCTYCVALTSFIYVPYHMAHLSSTPQWARSPGALSLATKITLVVANRTPGVLLGVFTGAVAIVLFGFAMYHLYLVWSDITTYEEHKWDVSYYMSLTYARVRWTKTNFVFDCETITALSAHGSSCSAVSSARKRCY